MSQKSLNNLSFVSRLGVTLETAERFSATAINLLHYIGLLHYIQNIKLAISLCVSVQDILIKARNGVK